MTRARPPWSTWLACVALVLAGALGITAWIVDDADRQELSASSASIGVVPSTVPPVAGLPPPAASAPPSAPSTAAPVTSSPSPALTTLPVSPLAPMVGDAVSVVPVAPVAVPPPVRLQIPAIAVDVPVRDVGVADDGQLEIPDETEVGWYRLGAAPGEPGATVVAGHVNWNRVDGPFLRLRDLEPGATVEVTMADGGRRTYVVVERQQYAKTELPAARIWTAGGPETLVLITCGGAFNPEVRRYRDNVVVYAVPVA